MKQDEIRRRLIGGAIRVIARDGLDKATTKSISAEAPASEVYIYRYFSDKDDLLAKAFESIDTELAKVCMQHVGIIYSADASFEICCRAYYSLIWRHVIENRDKFTAYIRYYYSPYFMRYSASSQNEIYAPLVSKFSQIFEDDTNVWIILGHIMNTVLDFAVKVYNGEVPDDEETKELVFRLIYCSVRQYFKK